MQQIQGELKRLNRLITDVSNASRLDAELARKEMRPIDVTAMLRNVVGDFPRHPRRRQPRASMLVDRQRAVRRRLLRQRRRGPARPGADQPHRQRHLVLAGGRHGDGAARARRHRSSRSSSRTKAPAFPRTAWRSSSTASIPTGRRPTRAAARTPGSGLSISREIVLAHGGQIVAENRYEDGAGRRARSPSAPASSCACPLPAQTQRGGAPGGRRS